MVLTTIRLGGYCEESFCWAKRVPSYLSDYRSQNRRLRNGNGRRTGLFYATCSEDIYGKHRTSVIQTDPLLPKRQLALLGFRPSWRRA